MKLAESPIIRPHPSRPSSVVEIEGKSRGGGNTPTDRITVNRYSDATLYDRMHQRAQLSDREHQAADRLARMWTAAGNNPRVSASHTMIREDEVVEFDAPMETCAADPDEPTARDRYRRMMRHAGEVRSLRVEAMLCDEHPGWRLPELQEALGYFGDVFGLEKTC